MSKTSFLITLICLAGLLACRLGAPAQETTPAGERVELPAGSQSTPTPPSGLTLRQAWQVAEPQVRAWAVDAQPSQSWRCLGRLSEAGICNHWEGTMASAAQTDVAQVITTDATKVEVRPSHSAQAGRPALEAAFSPEGIIDSPQILQTAWTWLEEQGLKETNSQVRNLALAAGPAQAQGCGETPHYSVAFDRPGGWLCLDAYTGQVTANTFGK